MSFAPAVNPAVQELGKQPYLPTLLSHPFADSQENKTLQNNLQLRWVLHTVPFSPHSLPLSQSPFSPPLTALFVSSANQPGGRISAVSQVPALALREGRALVKGDIGGEEGGGEGKRGEMCVLGKQGFVGCDCLIPGGLSFHSSSRLIPQRGRVARAVASLGSGTRLALPSPCASWIA